SLTAQERSEFAGFIALIFTRGERAFDLTNKLFLDVNAAKTLDWLKNPDEFNKWIKHRSQGGTSGTFFFLPLWLISGSIAFAIVVSLIAGSYPASRAAGLDPIQALRHD